MLFHVRALPLRRDKWLIPQPLFVGLTSPMCSLELEVVLQTSDWAGATLVYTDPDLHLYYPQYPELQKATVVDTKHLAVSIVLQLLLGSLHTTSGLTLELAAGPYSFAR